MSGSGVRGIDVVDPRHSGSSCVEEARLRNQGRYPEKRVLRDQR